MYVLPQCAPQLCLSGWFFQVSSCEVESATCNLIHCVKCTFYHSARTSCALQPDALCQMYVLPWRAAHWRLFQTHVLKTGRVTCSPRRSHRNVDRQFLHAGNHLLRPISGQGAPWADPGRSAQNAPGPFRLWTVRSLMNSLLQIAS